MKLTVLRDHQSMTCRRSVFVRGTTRSSSVSFATFRDRLRPGAERDVDASRSRARSGTRGGRPRPSSSPTCTTAAWTPSCRTSAQPSIALSEPDRVAWTRATSGRRFVTCRGCYRGLPGLSARGAGLPQGLRRIRASAGRPSARMYGDGKVRSRHGFPWRPPGEIAPASQLDPPRLGAAPNGRRVMRPGRGPGRRDAELAGVAAAREDSRSSAAFWRPDLLPGPDGARFDRVHRARLGDRLARVGPGGDEGPPGGRACSRKTTRRQGVDGPAVRAALPARGGRAELQVAVDNASDKGMSGKVTLDILEHRHECERCSPRSVFRPRRPRSRFPPRPGPGPEPTSRSP